ncbi:MAG: tetratricopeptide repeat protein, partial [Proteobacteria bacterium]|nr:tetratricopeptide repeat protein [Pseudomonadota bacterium]
MRPSALFVLVLAGSLLGACTPPPRPVTPIAPNGTATSRPASDLAHAKQEVVPQGEGGKLVVKDPRITDLDIIKVTVDPASGQTTSVASADLFRQAGEAVAAKRTQEAISLYRRVVSEFPDSIYGPISLFNIAAIHDGRGDYLATVETLHELVKTFPAARESVEGHLYIAALHAEHKDFAEASRVLDAALARSNLSYADRVEAFARKGYVELELGHLDVADAALEAAFGEW